MRNVTIVKTRKLPISRPHIDMNYSPRLDVFNVPSKAKVTQVRDVSRGITNKAKRPAKRVRIGAVR